MVDSGPQQGRISQLQYSKDGGNTWAEIECIREATMSLEKGEINATCRRSGEWEDFVQGRKSGTVEANALWDEGDAVILDIATAFYNDIVWDYRWIFVPGIGNTEYTMRCQVNSFSKGSPGDDIQTVDFTLRIKGPSVPGVQQP